MEVKKIQDEVIRLAKARGTDSAQVIQIIETRALRGSGTKEDPHRIITQYWNFEGMLLAENDPER